MSPRLISLAALPAFLASCRSVGPDYQSPPDISAPAFSQGDPSPAKDLTRWWHDFKDPKLDSLITRAFTANPDLRAAAARIDEARAASRSARGVAAGAAVAAAPEASVRRAVRASARRRLAGACMGGFLGGEEGRAATGQFALSKANHCA